VGGVAPPVADPASRFLPNVRAAKAVGVITEPTRAGSFDHSSARPAEGP
jgi:hypothetical protein